MLKKQKLLFILAILVLVLAACGGKDAPRGGECLGTAEGAVMDLDCREVTVAVETPTCLSTMSLWIQVSGWAGIMMPLKKSAPCCTAPPFLLKQYGTA